MSDHLKFYINGEWVDSLSSETIEVINPSDESVIGSISAGTKEDIDLAEDFDTKFSVKGRDKTAIKNFFTPELRQFIKENDKYHIESTDSAILVFRYFRVMSISEIQELLKFGEQLTGYFQKCVVTPKNTP